MGDRGQGEIHKSLVLRDLAAVIRPGNLEDFEPSPFKAGVFESKKNRASQSGGDRKARGIFELSTIVGLRRTSNLELYREPDPKSLMG